MRTQVGFASLSVLFLLPFESMRGDFCAVTLRVMDAEGTALHSIPLELVDSSGTVVSRTESAHGAARFCDFGFGEHSIIVGGDTQGSVVIRRISLIFDVEQRVSVVLNRTRLERFFLGKGPPSCRLYVRVSTSLGRPVAGATIRSDSIANARGLSDSYGRVMWAVPVGASSTVTVAAPNYGSQQFVAACSKAGELERRVVLSEETVK
jgi:hypothetical protein